jgi:hypothetical protein
VRIAGGAMMDIAVLANTAISPIDQCKHMNADVNALENSLKKKS